MREREQAEFTPYSDPDIPGTDDPKWIGIAKTFRHQSVAECRDRLDVWGWRRQEAKRHLVKEARKARTRPDNPKLGGYPGRSYRQVNAKLAIADFEALVALADQRDVAPSTMARMLLRGAIGRELDESSG